MVDFQLPLPGLARDFNELTKQEKDFIAYFSAIDMDSISPVVDCYAGIGPKGYNVFLILARIIKIKERILSDRQLAEVLRKNDLCRFVTNDIQPAHNTFNTLRKRLGPEGFVEIHKRFVLKAHSLGLLEPEIPDLPKHRKKGIILVADSTFLITCGSTKGEKDIHISRDSHYQLSNRVAYCWKIASMGIPVLLIYLGFIGDDGISNVGPPFRDSEHWQSVMQTYTYGVLPMEFLDRWIPCGKAQMRLLIRSMPVLDQSPITAACT